MAVLEAFSTPTSVRDALNALQTRVRGVQDYADLAGTLKQLFREGILAAGAETEHPLQNEAWGFGAPPVHIAMLNDEARTAGFISAIEEAVRPSDIVLDLGSGSGILAMAAARAGARKVFAVEATAIQSAARALFQANGLTERITLIPGWSTRIELPEKADLLVTEIFGDDALEERLLESVRDARRRLLKPAARCIPARVAVFGVPVSIPVSVLSRHVFTEGAAEDWRRTYDFNFEPLVGSEEVPSNIKTRPGEAREWKQLSEPILLYETALAAIESAGEEDFGSRGARHRLAQIQSRPRQNLTATNRSARCSELTAISNRLLATHSHTLAASPQFRFDGSRQQRP